MTSVWEQTASLASGLMVRWGIQGHNFGAANATRIATLLLSNGINKVVDIDFIKWTAEKSLMYGFNHKDLQLLVCAQIQGNSHWYSLVHTRDSLKSSNDAAIRKDVVREMIDFDLAKWCSVQPKIGDLFTEKTKSIVGR